MNSVEFRKSYAKLTTPTVVTVLGRPIGTWVPAGTENDVIVTNVAGTRVEGLAVRPSAGTRYPKDQVWPGERLNDPHPPLARPFTPAPKPGKR